MADSEWCMVLNHWSPVCRAPTPCPHNKSHVRSFPETAMSWCWTTCFTYVPIILDDIAVLAALMMQSRPNSFTFTVRCS